MTTDALFAQKISRIRQAGLYRQMRICHSPQGARVKTGGREVLMLSSNSYLGLCTDARLKEAARKAVAMYGTGAGGSRLISGTSPIHRELEAQVAFFKRTGAALIFSSGYMANAGVISSVADKNWVIYSDRLNHASIIDGCRLSGARTVVYGHGDVNDLENKIRRYPSNQGLIVTDALFSVDGDLAPLPALVATARRHGLLLMVDEAHATGVLGKNGSGAAELFGIKDGIDISTGTFSKALASEGGFVAGSAALIDYLVNTARSFIFSTAMPPAGAAVSLAALDIVRTEPQRRSTLMEHAAWLRDSLSRAGFDVANHPTQIVSLILGEPRTATAFSDRLMERGIFVTAIRPPTVPAGTSRLRISLMATHTRGDLEFAVSEITAVGHELGLIRREK
jgi:8-amino-7-oxononanoate synthase